MDKAALMISLTAEEGFRSVVYDDATGKDLKPGALLHGNPTLAIGWNISGRPCTYELGQIILGYHVDETWADVQKVFPWAVTQPEPVQRALTDMAFNLRGAAQLRTFVTFISMIQSGRYEDAAKDLETTLWWEQVGTRGPRIQALIRQGASVA